MSTAATRIIVCRRGPGSDVRMCWAAQRKPGCEQLHFCPGRAAQDLSQGCPTHPQAAGEVAGERHRDHCRRWVQQTASPNDVGERILVSVDHFSQFGLGLELRAEAEELRQSLQERPTVGVAKGMLMALYGYDEQDAFAELRRVSQQHRVAMAELAVAVVHLVCGPDGGWRHDRPPYRCRCPRRRGSGRGTLWLPTAGQLSLGGDQAGQPPRPSGHLARSRPRRLLVCRHDRPGANVSKVEDAVVYEASNKYQRHGLRAMRAAPGCRARRPWCWVGRRPGSWRPPATPWALTSTSCSSPWAKARAGD
jgi:hypothetical protein